MKILILLFAAVCLIGCNAPEPEPQADELPPQIAFEGEVDDKLIGEWATSNGVSRMDLRKEGTSTFVSQVNTPGGPQKVEVEGRWLTKDDALLLEDTSGGATKVIAYTYKLLSPEKLELSLSFPKSTTVYVKQ